jgi:hypothetical protein
MVVLARAICGWDLISYGAGNGFGSTFFHKKVDHEKKLWESIKTVILRQAQDAMRSSGCHA